MRQLLVAFMKKTTLGETSTNDAMLGIAGSLNVWQNTSLFKVESITNVVL